MNTCKNCIHWEPLLCTYNEDGICNNRCGKVKVLCKETESILNKDVSVLTKAEFGCVSFQVKK